MASAQPGGLARSLIAEAIGSASLLAAIVGSGIVTDRDGAASAQLFQHAVVVGLALTVLILVFGPVSGAHFNPVVTLVDAWLGGLSPARAVGYLVAQLVGAVAGTAFTNATFGTSVLAVATTGRGGQGLVAAEAAATAGLVVVIFGLIRSGRQRAVAGAVGAYIGAAIYFTASAAFANPAVTVARTLTDTWTGIRPADVPGFLAGQLASATAATLLVRWLFTRWTDETAADVPHLHDAPPAATLPTTHSPEGA